MNPAEPGELGLFEAGKERNTRACSPYFSLV